MIYGNANLDYLSYIIWAGRAKARPKKDINILIIGRAQSGKSTLASIIGELVYMRDNKVFSKAFVDHNMAFNSKQGLKLFAELKEDVLIADEGYFTADRREATRYIQVKYLEILNFLASQHNVIITIMQDYTDIDLRIVKKADILILVDMVGRGKVYADSKRFPIIKRQIINTDRFEKKPSLLNDSIGDNELRKDTNYIFEIAWGPRNDSIWKHYMEIKKGWQTKTLEQIDRTLTRMETQADFEDKVRKSYLIKKPQTILEEQEELIKAGFLSK